MTMSNIWYIAVEPFGPSSGRQWIDYLEWSQLAQLKALVSLDHMLCPSVIKELSDEDWQHNVQADYLTDFFTDVEYLLARLAGCSAHHVLAVIREPTEQAIQTVTDERFVFQGYDLIERPGRGISALTNCGGFDLAFKPTDISAVGLFDEYKFARSVQQRLLEHYPDEAHADCSLWAIWKMKDIEGG